MCGGLPARPWRAQSAAPSSSDTAAPPEATRRAFNKRFLTDLARDWEQHGPEVFKRVRRESPAAYLKVCAMLVPREMQIEHSGGVKAMSDEALENAIEALERMLGAKVIEGVAEPAALPAPPRRKIRKSDTRSACPPRAEEDSVS